MATDVIIKSFEEDLNKARSNLKGLNENIRRIVGREPLEENSRSDRNLLRKRNFGERESNRRSINLELERTRIRELSPPSAKISKRSAEGKSVFSRLSGHAFRDEDNQSYKPRLNSRVIKELPTREEVVEAQCRDEESRARNRRMFGCLLGTLQKFCQEESRLKPKEEKKAMVEKKLEEQEQREREILRRERQVLFIDRKRQQLEIRKLESKMILVEEFQIWEKSKRSLMNHIKTKKKPPIYFKPKMLNDKNKKMLTECQLELEKEIEKKKEKLNHEILQLDNRYKLREDEITFMKTTEEGRKLLDGTETKFYQRTGDGDKSESDGNEEYDYDSNYESDGREYDFANSERKYSKSVVVTVQNNYIKNNSHDYHYDNIIIEKENNSRNSDHFEHMIKQEKDNGIDDDGNGIEDDLHTNISIKIKQRTLSEDESNHDIGDVNNRNNRNLHNSVKIKREKDQKNH